MRRYLGHPRTWLVGGAVIAAAVFAVGWLVLIGPERASSGALRDQAAQSEQRSALLRTKIATLQAKSARADQYAATLEQAEAALPYDSGLPTFTRQLDAEAAAAGVHLNGLTVSGVTPAGSGSAGAATGSATGGTASSGAATPAPTTDGTTPAAGGLFSLRVTVTTKGSLSDQLAFLRALRSGPRRSLVGGTQFMPASTAKQASIERSSTLTTDVTVFSAPQTPQQVRQMRQLLAALRG